MAEGSKSE
jgi:hypothetical protein